MHLYCRAQAVGGTTTWMREFVWLSASTAEKGRLISPIQGTRAKPHVKVAQQEKGRHLERPGRLYMAISCVRERTPPLGTSAVVVAIIHRESTTLSIKSAQQQAARKPRITTTTNKPAAKATPKAKRQRLTGKGEIATARAPTTERLRSYVKINLGCLEVGMSITPWCNPGPGTSRGAR